MDKKDLYIELVNGDIAPLVRLRNQAATWQNIYTPYLCEQFKYYEPLDKIKTLDDIAPNLSKYIPENNNVIVFLSEEDQENYQNCFPNQHIGLYINDGKNDEEFRANNIESLISGIADVKKGNITLFLTNGTEEELEKAIEIAKELKEIYGVKEVNLFVLHWFYKNEDYDVISFLLYNKIFNKIITTNSTGILPVQNSERLQVIDCKEIFEEYLKTER